MGHPLGTRSFRQIDRRNVNERSIDRVDACYNLARRLADLVGYLGSYPPVHAGRQFHVDERPHIVTLDVVDGSNALDGLRG